MAHANLRLQGVKKFQRCLIHCQIPHLNELAYNLTKKARLRSNHNLQMRSCYKINFDWILMSF